MADLAPGQTEMTQLQQAGFTPSDIDQWQTDTAGQLSDAGFSGQEVDEYFGKKTPDLKPTETRFKENLAAKAAAEGPQPKSGQVEAGNIDLNNRPRVKNEDGSISTVRSLGVNIDGQEVLIPTVSEDGRVMSDKDAIDTYKKTGRHLGKFDSVEASNKYAQSLHEDQAELIKTPQGTMPTDPEHPAKKQADSFLEAIEAGFDMSVVGLLQGRPDMVLPEHAPMFYRIASQVSQLAGDVPAMIAGSMVGAPAGAAVAGAAGSVVPVAGTAAGIAVGGVMGAGFGAFALPEGMRTALMEHYEKGDVQSFGDFWERASAVAINSLKAGAVGAATAGVGGVAAKVAGPAIVKTSAQLASEVLTMTTVGAALDGRIPEPHEFIDGAILVAGMHGAMHVAGKARAIYSQTGVPPAEVVAKAAEDPHFKQQMLSDNVPVPMGGEFGQMQFTKAPENVPTVKPLRESNPDLSTSVNTILGRVGEQAERPKKSMTTGQIYTALVDKLDPINQATKELTGAKELPAEKNPYILSRTAVDYKSKAKHMFENGTLDFRTLETNGPSLKSTLEGVENVEVLEAYMISKRAIEKHGQGIVTGFDLEAAKSVVKEHGAQYEAAAQKVTEFSNGTLKYMLDAGIISSEQHARMSEANKDYVPFKRLMDPEEAAAGGRKGGKGGSLKEMKGSERGIQSPLTSIVENTIELVRIAEMNRPKEALVKLAEATPDQKLLKRVPDRMQAIEVKGEEIERHLENQGLDPSHAGLVEDLTIFRKQQADLAKNQFAIYKEGKRLVYETTPELAEAVARLGGDTSATNMLFKLANGVTTIKKIGITFTPDFIIRNFMRDYLTASTFSKSKGMSPIDVLSAVGDVWKKNDAYYDWLKSGGANGAFLDLGEKYVTNDIYKLQKQTNFLNSVRNLVEKPIDIMRVAAELSEQGMRVAEFKKVRKMGGTLTEGGYASREITIDFQRVGAKMSALNSITAFMNVSIQGVDRTVRAFKDDPAGVATKSLAYITVPSMLLWWANHDDPRYQEIPRWEKDMFWVIPTDKWTKSTHEEADGLPEYMVREAGGGVEVNKGTIYRIPKPQELGILFGSLPERTLESFFGSDPKSYKEFDKTMIGLVTPSFVPDAVAPAVEQYFNKSFFTGRDIVPNHLKEILPEYQFVEYTSETAKTLGKLVATVDKQSNFASPMVLQNYIRSWGGSLGQYAVQLADKALVKTGVVPDTVAPESTLSDLPFIKSFVVRFPAAGSNSVQDFYGQYEENKQVLNTIKHLAKEGDFDSLQKEMDLKANQEKLITLDGIKEALSTQSKFIRLVNKNPEIKPDEKRQMIDGAYMMMTETAKQGNLLMQEVKKSLGE